MTTFTANVRVEGGMLHTSRPMTAPDAVRDMIDSVIYTLASGDGSGDLVSVDLTVETSGESDTPIGDSTSGTSSTPLAPTAIDTAGVPVADDTVDAAATTDTTTAGPTA